MSTPILFFPSKSHKAQSTQWGCRSTPIIFAQIYRKMIVSQVIERKPAVSVYTLAMLATPPKKTNTIAEETDSLNRGRKATVSIWCPFPIELTLNRDPFPKRTHRHRPGKQHQEQKRLLRAEQRRTIHKA